MSNICYFIHTCDEYQTFWNGWHVSYEKFWPKTLDWNVYFVNEELECPYNDVTQLKTFTSKKEWITETREVDSHGNPLPTKGLKKQFDHGWSDRLITALENIEEEYLLYIQEDMWLKHEVDPGLFQNAYRFVERSGINILRVHRLNTLSSNKDFLHKTDYFVNDHRLLKIDKKAGYLMNHQPAIWKKSFLQEVLVYGESFRDNEFEGTERIRKYDDPKIYHLNYDWCYGMPGAAAAGKFHTFSYEQEWHENVNDVCLSKDLDLKRTPYEPKSQGLKLSLVTSCYRAEKFIEELSESVFGQTYDNWEWIVADDFSDDNTLSKLHELQAKDPRIRLVYPNFKKEIWWNPQIHATGDIVCHIDSDDKLLPTALEQIIHYFSIFPEAVLMHFNANKYHGNLPVDKNDIFKDYKDNVYMTRDNDSFLEGFEKLWANRTNIFGYLRVFRNLPGLDFPVHQDGDACSSNDGQWLLMLEERGKWITIPRTNYIAREHGDSENFRRWNPRGEAQLAIDAKERRKSFVLEYPRNIKYFDDIYDSAEALYTSRVNFEKTPNIISFINYDYSNLQKEKIGILYYDHDVRFDEFHKDVQTFVLKINLNTTPQDIVHFCNEINNSKNAEYEIIIFSDNAHLHTNNRTGTDQIKEIKEAFVSCGYHFNWFIQDNRFHANAYVRNKQIIEKIDFKEEEIVEIEKPKPERDYLKIMQIHVGCGLSIPPKGYGGLEEVMHHYIRIAQKRGHEVTLKWLDDVNQNDLEEFDVFHNHTGGFFDLVKDRCIPYIFTMHDTFAKLNGKDSWFYNSNVETIKNSLFTLIPTDDMYDWFGMPDKMRKLNHGVDSNFYYPVDKPKDIRLCCVGGGDDRKGFHLAVIAAQKLGLPITIIGPDSIHDNYNQLFYQIIDQAKNDIEIHQTGNVEKPELKSLLNQHHIIIHPASIETGQPCLAVLEAMSCGLPCVGTMQDNVEIPGLIECTREVDTIVDGVKTILNDYDDYSKKARSFAVERDWENIFDELEQYYYEAKEMKYTKPFKMKDRLIFSYDNTPKKIKQNQFTVTVKPNPYLKITGTKKAEYDVTFMDDVTKTVHYSQRIGVGAWAACTISYFVPWRIIAKNIETGEIEFEYVQDLKDKKVFIWYDSLALGDALAWMPILEQFRIKHQCKIIASTFFNDLFRDRYPQIQFETPENGYEDFDFKYKIGWMIDDQNHMSGSYFNYGLQECASKILGLDYVEIPAKITVREEETEIKKPYVCIGTQSTAQAKYWNYEGGWDEIVKYLKKKGYEVVCIDKHAHFGNSDFINSVPNDTIKRQERTLDQTIATLNGAEFFIGLGSGLSWLAWALNKHVVLISGFSKPYSEFQFKCERVFNENVCNGCYNRYIFDPGNWKWCPDHEDTDRMFECTKTITPKMVKTAINKTIKKINA